MRVVVESSSAAVTRTFAEIIEAAGHSLAKAAEQADLTLIDCIHPTAAKAPSGPSLALVAGDGAATENSLSCPIAPQALIQRLTGWQLTQSIALAHGWVLDALARRLTHADGQTITLTEKECALLRQLVTARAQTMPREDLLEAVWGVADSIDTHTLETHIYRLRSKLEGLAPPAGDILTDSGTYRWLTKD